MFKRLVELLKDALAYGTSSIIQKLIGFILIPLYTRYLQPEDYGLLGMLLVMQTVLESFVLLGQKSAVFRQVGLVSTNEERAAPLTMGLMVVGVSGAATLLVGQLFAQELSDIFLGKGQDVNLVRVTLVSSYLNVLCEMPRMALQASRKAKTAAGLTAAQTFTTTTLTLGFVVGLEWGVWGLVWAVFATYVPFTVIYLALCRKFYGFTWNSNMARELLRYGLPFVPYRVQMMLFAMFGEYAVRNKLGLEDAGVYNVARRFALPLGFIVGAITNAWWGYKFHLFREEKEPAAAISSLTTYTFAGLTYLWVGVSLWGPEVLMLMTPEKFHGGVDLISALAMFTLLTGIYQMLTSGIELGNDAKPIFLVGLCGLSVVVPLGLWTIPVYGAIAAALSMCAGQVIINFAGYKLAQTRFQVSYDWLTVSLIFFVAIGFVFLGWLSTSLSTELRITSSLALSVIYPACVILFLARSKAERERMLYLFTRIKKLKRS